MRASSGSGTEVIGSHGNSRLRLHPRFALGAPRLELCDPLRVFRFLFLKLLASISLSDSLDEVARVVKHRLLLHHRSSLW